MRGDADNVVFLTEFVDSGLRITEVFYLKVGEADEPRSAYTWLTVAHANKFDGDNIQWDDVLPNEQSRRSRIALEEGHWVSQAVTRSEGTVRGPRNLPLISG
jgi:hypothetical protein